MCEIMAKEETVFDELRAELPGAVVLAGEPLARRTTLRAGGRADVYVEPSSETELACAVQICGERNVPLLVLGRGSNLLIRDGGVRGVVVCLAHAKFCGIEVFGRQLRCGAGARLKEVSARAREAELSGLEFLEGIPGSVGGALRMNAGAMGSATFDLVTQVRFMDDLGRIHERDAAGMNPAYRSCSLLKSCIALEAAFEGRPASREIIAARTREFNERRWRCQPKEPSAGCIFKNPSPAMTAGALIDQAGLKGARVGGASVSTVHANFIITDGTAAARDVLELIELIRSRVKASRGIDLQTEVEIVGEDTP
jgi:UDP-N-acetylenolpyruvoylglucosamine reductase